MKKTGDKRGHEVFIISGKDIFIYFQDLMKKFTQYVTVDFVLDESFRSWVYNEDPEAATFWREWIALHPEMKSFAEEARRILLDLRMEEVKVSPSEIARGYREIEHFFEQTVHQRKKSAPGFYLKIAAAVLVLVTTALGLYIHLQPEEITKQYATATGEHKKIQLPDGSSVYMKGDTKMSYALNWRKKQERKVKLQGEAYFQVRETLYEGNQLKFIVKTDNILIEVVGTEFMVNNRDFKTKVTLNSGRVRLQAPQNKTLNMNPGDVVEYNAISHKLVTLKPDLRQNSSWMNDFKDWEEQHQRGKSHSANKKEQFHKGNTAIPPDNKNKRQDAVCAGTQAAISNQTENRIYKEEENGQKKNPKEYHLYTGQQNFENKPTGVLQEINHRYLIHPVGPNSNSEKGNVSQIIQQGEQNTAYIEQIGEGLRSQQHQFGNQNQARVYLKGETNREKSVDLSWSTKQLQNGSANRSIFKLIESYNIHISSNQYGTGNQNFVESSGYQNIGIIQQQGTYNKVQIDQNGMSNQTRNHQVGRLNEIEIIQKAN